MFGEISSRPPISSNVQPCQIFKTMASRCATGKVAKAWGDVQLTPSTFIVNKRGEIVKTYVGAPNFPELHQLIEKLLAET